MNKTGQHYPFSFLFLSNLKSGGYLWILIRWSFLCTLVLNFSPHPSTKHRYWKTQQRTKQISWNASLKANVWESAAYHVLFLGEDGEKRVVPLLDVNVQEPGARQRAAAGAAHVSVQGVVVVLVVVQRAEDGAAAGDVTGELRHAEDKRRRGWQLGHKLTGGPLEFVCHFRNYSAADLSVLVFPATDNAALVAFIIFWYCKRKITNYRQKASICATSMADVRFYDITWVMQLFWKLLVQLKYWRRKKESYPHITLR